MKATDESNLVKPPKPNVSKSQISQARQYCILDYLKTYEPNNIKKHSVDSYKLVDHDSLKIFKSRDGEWRWHWHSRDISGKTALDFMTRVRGIGFVDAVKQLASYDSNIEHKTLPSERKNIKESLTLPKPMPQMPEAHFSNVLVSQYLSDKRGVDPDIIQHCIGEGVLYQAKDSHNCVFVGKDNKGTPRYMTMRGTGDNKFVQDIENSDKSFGFSIPVREERRDKAKTLFVFESPIDAMSKASLDKQHPEKGHYWDCVHRLSLGGTSDKALNRYLADNPNIRTINLNLDNDLAGQKAAERIKDMIEKQFPGKYDVNIRIPEGGVKDWNEVVMAKMKWGKYGEVDIEKISGLGVNDKAVAISRPSYAHVL